MQLLEMFHQAGWAAIFSILVALFPMIAGIAYLARPTEDRLALIRPISLAGLFSALAGVVLGFMNVLKMMWTHETPPALQVVSAGLAESLVTLVIGFGSLTACWLCVAVGMRRRSNGQ